MKIHILKWSCPDQIGLLARITTLLADAKANLLDVGQYTDPLAKRFFARLAFDMTGSDADLRQATSKLANLAREVDADWHLRPGSTPYKAAIFVSRLDHCLLDLLWRWRSGELRMEIALVISNHDDCRAVVEREGIPFHRISFAEDKAAAFATCAALLRTQQVDLAILARFMQILPDWFCAEWPGRIINIHHSFLPAFVGANPYRRAFERGVKLIGATCHYAT
ncbi:MAG: formyltetrahydrofolate deformylase, partial [Verrucomicrobiia bacterium]